MSQSLNKVPKNIVSVDAILFDLDGTLVDTAPDFITVLNQQRLDFGLPPLLEHAIRDTVSDGARALTALAFGGKEGEEEFEAKRQDLLTRYKNKVGNDAKLFDGMEKTLRHFENLNIPWGIITNKPRVYTDILLSRLKLDQRSAITLCPDDVKKPKPDPEVMILASRELNIELTNTVYVGDHIRDIQAGKAANMITVAAAYGYISAENKISAWGAKHEIHHPSELISLFIG